MWTSFATIASRVVNAGRTRVESRTFVFTPGTFINIDASTIDLCKPLATVKFNTACVWIDNWVHFATIRTDAFVIRFEIGARSSNSITVVTARRTFIIIDTSNIKFKLTWITVTAI